MLYAQTQHLVPVPTTQIKLLRFFHVRHDIVNAPRLELISRRVVGRQIFSIAQVLCAVLDGLHTLLVVLICVDFGVMLEYPGWQLGLSTTRIELDLAPVGVLEKFGVGEAELLSARCTHETKISQVSRLNRM